MLLIACQYHATHTHTNTLGPKSVNSLQILTQNHAHKTAKNYRKRHDPEQQPFADSQGKAVPPSPEKDSEGNVWPIGSAAPQSMEEVAAEVIGFAKEPVPFLMETAGVDDDTVHQRCVAHAAVLLLNLVMRARLIEHITTYGPYVHRRILSMRACTENECANSKKKPHSTRIHTLKKI
jgi:hypothetical protein